MFDQRKCYGDEDNVLADDIIFVYEVPCIFWHYINVDEVSWITLKKSLQSAMELLQIAAGITKCDDYYKLRQYIPQLVKPEKPNVYHTVT